MDKRIIITKSIALQLFWFAIVLYGKDLYFGLSLLFAFLFIIIDFKIFKPKMHFNRYFLLSLFFICYGFINDYFLIYSNIIDSQSYSFNYVLLWVVFIAYYEHILESFNNTPIYLNSIVGGIGGVLAYLSASKLEAFKIQTDQEYPLVITIFISWAVFFPLSTWIYNMKSFTNYILDKLIITSFDSTGFMRHQKYFTDYVDLTALGEQDELVFKKALVTGGTGGIGESVLSSLDTLGVSVNFIGRNSHKGESLESKYLKSHFIKLDMGNWKDIRKFQSKVEHYDYVIFNAGAMPDEKKINENGVELQCASQLLGHFILLKRLKDNKQISATTKIVWVSSGGMYLKKLSLKDLLNPLDYDKVDTYANVKRAQVTLVEELSNMDDWKEFQNFSMHPGWVGTPGLKEALPKFYNLLRNRLRTPYQGADTIVWLLITKESLVKGGFYFDRKKMRPYFFSGFNPSVTQRKELTKIVNRFIT